jgi:hypothetical protein
LDEGWEVILELANSMVHFEHGLLMPEEIESLKQYCLAQGDTAWNLISFSDQVSDML